MHGCCFGFRHLVARSLGAVLLVGCAEGGLSDAELAAAQGNVEDDDDDDGSGATGSSKDAGKDARSASSDEAEDSGKPKDAGSASGGDAGRPSSSRTDAGAGTLPTIKCPSNLVCTTNVLVIAALSTLDPNVKSDTAVCAQDGTIPMAVSCKSDSECSSARLTSAKCSGSYCIQACVK